MKRNRLSSRTHGLFGRLLFIFLGLVIAMVLSFVLSFHFFNKGQRRHVAKKNLETYALYLAKEIGTPPKEEKVREMAKELGLSIAVFSDSYGFRTSESLPSLAELKEMQGSEHKHFKKKHFVRVSLDGFHFVFGIDRSVIEKPIRPIIFAIFLSLVFVIIAYHMVNRLFAPLNRIHEAAGAYAQGDFTHQIPVSGNGMLAELSRDIQEMGRRIQSMLDAKRELLLAIAHELRTPLTRAKLHLELLEESEAKAKLSEELDEMSQQITDLLEGERLKDGHNELYKESVNLRELIEKVKQKNFSDAKIDFQGEDVFLEIDATKYALVVKNLLSNAIRYGQGKPIELKLTRESFSVVDRGQGIPQEEIASITEAFYRVEKSRERSKGGVGLGLYLVRQVVEAHGHRLEIKSHEQTEFRVWFNP